jgi:hypothetical protein
VRQCHLGLEREEERASRPAVATAPAPQIARLLAMQQSAGNQAVGRILSRLTVGLDTSKEDRSEIARLQKLHTSHFGPNGRFPRPAFKEEWAALLKQATTVKNLSDTLDAVIEQARAAAPPPAQPRPQPPRNSPPPEQKPPEPKSPWGRGSVPPTVREAPAPKPRNAQAPSPPDELKAYKDEIGTWDARKHSGMDAAALSLAEVQELLNWLKGTWKWKEDVYFKKGAGTGPWSTKAQLKVIAWSRIRLGGNKLPTFHFTLKPTAYAALDLDEVQADWEPTPEERELRGHLDEARASRGQFAEQQQLKQRVVPSGLKPSWGS